MAKHKAVKEKRKHKAVRGGKRRRHPLLAIAGVIIVLAVAGFSYLWFAPASMIPLPQSERVCRVVSGGTLRAETTNCGLILIRGHEDLIAGGDYRITSTGPIAWSIVEDLEVTE